MAYCILFLFGLVTLWLGIKAADEVHQLALASTAFIPLGWGYFSSPFLFQCICGVLILGAYQIYISIVESSL